MARTQMEVTFTDPPGSRQLAPLLADGRRGEGHVARGALQEMLRGVRSRGQGVCDEGSGGRLQGVAAARLATQAVAGRLASPLLVKTAAPPAGRTLLGVTR